MAVKAMVRNNFPLNGEWVIFRFLRERGLNALRRNVLLAFDPLLKCIYTARHA